MLSSPVAGCMSTTASRTRCHARYRATPIGAGRRNEAGGGEGVAASDRSGATTSRVCPKIHDKRTEAPSRMPVRRQSRPNRYPRSRSARAPGRSPRGEAGRTKVQPGSCAARAPVPGATVRPSAARSASAQRPRCSRASGRLRLRYRRRCTSRCRSGPAGSGDAGGFHRASRAVLRSARASALISAISSGPVGPLSGLALISARRVSNFTSRSLLALL